MKGEISFSYYPLFSLNIQGATLTHQLYLCIGCDLGDTWIEDEAHSQFPPYYTFNLATLHLRVTAKLLKSIKK